MGKSYRVSADIGGTFTDLVFQNAETGQCNALKILSTPENPAYAVLKGLEKGIGDDENVDFFIHGTTVGLNSVLTRRGAKVALLTTEKFKDVYTIQGNDRGEIFSIRWKKPLPLVSKMDTYTVKERIAADGSIVTPITLSDLDEFIEEVLAKKYEAVAVALLFAFKNPDHELAIEEYLSQKLPDITIVLSHKVSPEWREFDRISTTVMDAYTAPVVRRYLETLVEDLSDRLPDGSRVHVMESNGGAMTAEAAAESPLQTLLSGPVGGAIGGGALSGTTGRQNLICVDMGGTSFDTSLVVDGKPSTSNETTLEGLPIQMSVVDIHVIGAGGGSIAWEEVSALRVGPQSAGSTPGPACYGRGGKLPTVSDANLVLRRLDASNFSGGEMVLDRDKALDSMKELGKSFKLSEEKLAQGIIDIINAKMADAIRTITVQRGIDPRDFSLLAYGGAGPAQAAALADQLDISEVIIPNHPGVFSAWGMLQTDVRHDFKTSFYGYWDAVELADVNSEFSKLEERGLKYLMNEGLAESKISFERFADFRYEGQEYVLTIAINSNLIDMDAVRLEFDEAYKRQYGHSSSTARMEVTNLRLAALGKLDRPEIPTPTVEQTTPARHRTVYFDDVEQKTMLVNRRELEIGSIISGPAIIEEETATTLVPPTWQMEVMTDGHMSLTKKMEG